MHRSRENDVFLQTGNDVIVISLPGVHDVVFDNGFWKASPKLISMLYWHIMPTFNRKRIMWASRFGWGFRTVCEKLEVLGENDPKEVDILENTCLEGIFLAHTAFWAIVRKDRLRGLGCRTSKEKKYIHTWTKSAHCGVVFHHQVDAPFMDRLRWKLAPSYIVWTLSILCKFNYDRLQVEA